MWARGQAGGRWERRGVGVAGVTAELSKNRLRVGGLTSRHRRLPLANPFIIRPRLLPLVSYNCLFEQRPLEFISNIAAYHRMALLGS